ncbi:hypothetical protein [Streptomyces sp. NBC_01198]|uniref:hypothetical protein n=1 Tax=Streptomyces sp. NBC_01198 TaxID=2903769 RepID=UPI002E10FDD3|nr:hypothetical protein OG702_26700 [Streptomyces sp. NBC_01198]
MTLLALASAFLATVTLGYAAVCAGQPFARCRKCDGMGHAITYTRRGKARRGKDCRRCDGHGIRIRRGRHLYNAWRRTYDRGNRPTTPARPFRPNQGERP